MPASLSAELPITIRTPSELLAAIDRFRDQQVDRPTRPEAIRRVLEASLAELKRA